MVRVVPARIEDGRIVPQTPLPEAERIRSVSILLELAEPASAERAAALSRLVGILKHDVPDARAEYREFVDQKYE